MTDLTAYIILRSSGEIWHRKRKRFVPYYDSANPPYRDIGTAQAAKNRMHKRGTMSELQVLESDCVPICNLQDG